MLIHSSFLRADRATLALILPLLLVGCSTVKPTPTAAEPPLRIIDIHTHTFGIDESGEVERKASPGIRKQYLDALHGAGFVGAIAHSSDLDLGYMDLKSENVIHCAGIRPPVRQAELERGLKSGKYGCLKIYLGYVHKYATDPAYEPAYRLAEKYKVPVVFHTGDTSTSDARIKFSDPLLIDDLAVRYRKVNFVIAHCGNPWIETAAEIAYKNPNVYLDGSAFLIGDLDKLPPATVEEYVVKPLRWIFGYLDNPRKLMFGTDYPLTRQASYVEPFKRAIPPQYWKDVFHDNAVRVFGLKD